MSLADKAVLVTVNVSQFSGQYLDRSIAAQAAASHEAEADTVRATRVLVPKKLFRDVNAAANRVRSVWMDSTSPWMSDGTRILPGRILDRFSNEMREAKTAFCAETDAFSKAYLHYRDSGQARSRLGDLYREEDFPDGDVIRSKFNVDVTTMPVPNVNDWRLDDSIRLDEQNRLKEQLEDRLRTLERESDSYWLSKFHRLLSTLERGLSPKKRVYRKTVDQLVKIANDIAIGNLTAPPDVQQKAALVENLALTAIDSKPGSTLRGATQLKLQDIMFTVNTAIDDLEAS